MPSLGLVAALPAEAAAFCGHRLQVRRPLPAPIQLTSSVALCISGIGSHHARRAAEALVDGGATALASWGVAGGLHPSCHAGDLLIPVALHTPEDPEIPCDRPWRERLEHRLQELMPVHSGPHRAVEEIARTPVDKARLAIGGALGVDLESGAVATVARAAGLPFIVVRAVCDPHDLAIPQCATAAITADGRMRPLALLTSVCRHPGELPDLLRLRAAAAAALRTLALVARSTDRNLALSGP